MKASFLGALGAEIVLLGCASPTTDRAAETLEYQSQDGYQRLLENYRAKSRHCRKRGGVMVSTGTFRRGIGGVLSEEQMRAARCVARH